MKILSEDQTMDIALSGRSITRVGEGELKYSITRMDIKSQKFIQKLADEIKTILTTPSPALACLPRNYPGMPSEPFWRKFERKPYTDYYKLPIYGSAFISRPDMMKGIDKPDYWQKVKQLWTGKNVTLAAPSPKMLRMPEAASVAHVPTPIVQAYDEIDRIEEEIGRPSGPVLLCIGATATALAARLARKGLWALDMGHMGHFMAVAGFYSVDRRDLISDEYLRLMAQLHAIADFGVSGSKYCPDVFEFAKALNVYGVLDYGCGQGTLKHAMVKAGFAGPIQEYDPAIKARADAPKPADLVVCTDVLEHVELNKLDKILAHIFALTKIGAYFAIATRPAKKILPDGRNAHLIQRLPSFWLGKLEDAGFKIERKVIIPDHEVKFWCRKS